MTSKRVRFEGHLSNELSGTLHRAEKARGGILMAHCFTCSSDLSVNVRIARRLVERGYHVLRFDFTGLGRSGGAFGDSTFVSNVGDLVKAAQWMIDAGLGPTGMFGHSLGGAASLIAARKVRTVKSLVLLGAPSTADHILDHIATDDVDTIELEGCHEVELAGRRFPISKEFLDDLTAYEHGEATSTLGLPLAIIHSPDDRTVPITEGERLFAAARQPKAFFPLLGADHLVTDPVDARRAADFAADWFDMTGAGEFAS
ncbi:MAG TPA: alpha/beta hydrolase [Acidimicrobiia bacterium]|jgi:putative redox protein